MNELAPDVMCVWLVSGCIFRRMTRSIYILKVWMDGCAVEWVDENHAWMDWRPVKWVSVTEDDMWTLQRPGRWCRSGRSGGLLLATVARPTLRLPRRVWAPFIPVVRCQSGHGLLPLLLACWTWLPGEHAKHCTTGYVNSVFFFSTSDTVVAQGFEASLWLADWWDCLFLCLFHLDRYFGFYLLLLLLLFN